jgi:hypothetical protein
MVTYWNLGDFVVSLWNGLGFFVTLLGRLVVILEIGRLVVILEIELGRLVVILEMKLGRLLVASVVLRVGRVLRPGCLVGSCLGSGKTGEGVDLVKTGLGVALVILGRVGMVYLVMKSLAVVTRREVVIGRRVGRDGVGVRRGCGVLLVR